MNTIIDMRRIRMYNYPLNDNDNVANINLQLTQ